jgi:hypothetical protein
MWKMRASAVVTTAFAFMFLMSFASNQVFADETVKLSPGAKVEVHGNSAIINNGGNGETGSFNCDCWGGSGTCKLTRGPNAITCTGNAGSCTGSCVLTTSTEGVTAAPPASKGNPSAPGKPSGASPAPPQKAQ